MKSFRERMSASAEANGSRTVLALDFVGPYDKRANRAMAILEETGDQIAAVKLNHHLLLPLGLDGLQSIIEGCRSRSLPIIADLKLNDIESTNLAAAEALLDFGVDCVIANPFAGKKEGLGSTLQRLHERGGGMILLAYMSHEGSPEGFGLTLEGGEPVYVAFAERARDWMADGVVVSAKDPDKVREVRKIVQGTCDVYSPGVGHQGGDAHRAVEAGADYLIIGRSIVEARDPRKAAMDLKLVPA